MFNFSFSSRHALIRNSFWTSVSNRGLNFAATHHQCVSQNTLKEAPRDIDHIYKLVNCSVTITGDRFMDLHIFICCGYRLTPLSMLVFKATHDPS